MKPVYNPLPPEVSYAIWIAATLLSLSLLGAAFRTMRTWPEAGISEGVDP
jgi:hypothetical protein